MKEITHFPIYIINLEERKDRLNHILNEFKDKEEFIIELIQSEKNKKGNVGLWDNIKRCVNFAIERDQDFIIICEDDHVFTKDYSRDFLHKCIRDAYEKKCNVLSGGVSWFETGIQISNDLFWIEKFTGLQFTVIFKSLFRKIMAIDFSTFDAADQKITFLSSDKLLIYPFISNQKEFGYSDVTDKNNKTYRVEKLFDETQQKLEILNKVRNYYLQLNNRENRI
ncbi:hypothetical protein BAX97_17440 [Elizabethkingia meningoseptica]|uniref:hypothetical protein n=1 Tax=Elizabethkingia meningoseptica TaxID=238 RepID=UPI000372DA1B|nr:hypothetical protein [Elizabethkingia meningoseptica]AQX04882.1 hypothetical protein BBD33_06330 [Elizabethkingia meningoseptica]AQX46923.1 hypothetical protein B5G46_06320 [Elizabethkingia meningoseptica]KUY18101.1 hypothetical protein ATB99_07570 [Elizabethkingia meningoseptica]MDE5488972.1 hypothetical protein [Elizabethkingia meningoseptica]MVW92236.1 hypothetical protein [Elizabethkingia meningoseptica]